MPSQSRETLVTREETGLDRRTYLAILSTLGGTSLAGCAGDSPEEGTETSGAGTDEPTQTATPPNEEAKGGTLNVSLESTISSLDAAKSGLQITNVVLDNITQSLFYVSRDLVAEAELVNEVEISDDGLTWDLHLREGVMWHPPYKREFVAEDVIYNFDRLYEAESSWTSNLKHVESYEAVGDYTVRLNFDYVAASTKAYLDHKGMELYSPDAIEDGKDPKNHPVGTGPFKFEEWVTGSKLTLSRFDDYWETDAQGNQLPYLDEVVMKPISESSVKITELQSGNIDLVRSPPRTRVEELQDNDSINVGIKQSGGWRALHLNTSDTPKEGRGPETPFTEKKARHAAAAALDWNSVIDVVENGYARKGQTWWPKESYWHVDHAPYEWEGKPEKSKRLLEEAGFDLPVEIRIISTSESQIAKDLSRVAQSSLNQGGFDVELKEFEIATWVDNLFAFKYDMSPNFVQLFDDPDKLRINLGPNTPVQPYWRDQDNNESEKVFELFEKGNRTLDREKRKEHYDELQRTAVDDAPIIVFSHPKIIHAYRNSVKGYETYPYRIGFPLQYTWVDR